MVLKRALDLFRMIYRISSWMNSHHWHHQHHHLTHDLRLSPGQTFATRSVPLPLRAPLFAALRRRSPRSHPTQIIVPTAQDVEAPSYLAKYFTPEPQATAFTGQGRALGPLDDCMALPSIEAYWQVLPFSKCIVSA
jgi:hypothetical protein